MAQCQCFFILFFIGLIVCLLAFLLRKLSYENNYSRVAGKDYRKKPRAMF